MTLKEDVRVVRTRKLLTDTLLSLMEKQSIERISVMDLCEKAMINRATFYKHFDDKYDLLCFALEEIRRNMTDSFAIKESNADTPSDTIRAVFSTAIEFLFNNRGRIANILSNNYNGRVIATVEETISNSILLHIAKYTDSYAVKVPLPLLAKFLAGGLVTTAIWCITSQRRYTYDEYLTFAQAGCMDGLFEKI